MKKRQSNANKSRGRAADVSDTEEFHDAVDSSASNFIYDAVDEYYENEEREGAEKLAKLMKRPKTFGQNEVLGIASSSEDEEVYTKKPKKKVKQRFEESEVLPPLDSDLEEDKEEDDEEEKITNQWGKKRSVYYNADYVDEDWNDANEDDAEMAELEEQGALAIQQRIAQQLEEDDFGLDFITHLKEAEKAKEVKSVEEKIDVNLSQLSKREKLKLLNEESPELLELIEDFKVQMNDLKETISPLMKLIEDGVIPPSSGADFIKAKYHLIMNYCTQIAYYFVLKSKRVSIQNHPVIKRMVQFRALLHQLDSTGSNLRSEMQELLIKISEEKTILPDDFRVAPPKKNLRIISRTSEKKEKSEKKSVVEIARTIKTKENSFVPALTRDEQAAVDFYKAVRKDKKKKMDNEDDSDQDHEVSKDDVDDKQDEESTEEIGKRAINYQIAKNKGLTPHRSKEQRNPRVKHRNKFRKAKIRRKGAVREVRKEITKYGGEISGIKAGVVKSVKLR